MARQGLAGHGKAWHGFFNRTNAAVPGQAGRGGARHGEAGHGMDFNYTEDELIELFDERAAIREFDGGMSRKDAEREAYYDLRRLVGNDVYIPEAIRELVRKFRPE